MLLNVLVDLVERKLLGLCLCVLIDLVLYTGIDKLLGHDLPPLVEVLLLHLKMEFSILESLRGRRHWRQRPAGPAFCIPLVDGSPDDVLAR